MSESRRRTQTQIIKSAVSGMIGARDYISRIIQARNNCSKTDQIALERMHMYPLWAASSKKVRHHLEGCRERELI
jgi:hypothetical protein